MGSKKKRLVLGLAMAGIAAIAWMTTQYLQKQAAFQARMVGQGGPDTWGRSHRFDKRIFHGPGHLQQSINHLLRNPQDLKSAFRGKRISQAFAERIMLAITGVNRCRYCSFAHAQAAASAGITSEEVARLLGADLSQVDPSEAIALAFAIHYAENNETPAPGMVARLEEAYGIDTARDIQTLIKIITLGNLAGNTWDAFLSRLRGRPAEGSSLGGELATLGLMLVGLIPVSLVIAVRVALLDTHNSRKHNVLMLQP